MEKYVRKIPTDLSSVGSTYYKSRTNSFKDKEIAFKNKRNIRKTKYLRM